MVQRRTQLLMNQPTIKAQRRKKKKERKKKGGMGWATEMVAHESSGSQPFRHQTENRLSAVAAAPQDDEPGQQCDCRRLIRGWACKVSQLFLLRCN